MGGLGKGLRAASFTSTEVLSRPGGKVPEMAGKGPNTGLVPYYGTTQVTRL